MQFKGSKEYVSTDDLSIAVNAAINLEKPLLVKGEPGTGKTELARQISKSLNLEIIEWNIKSTTKAQQGLYEYDAVSRLRDSQIGDQNVSDISKYIKKGKIWNSFESKNKSVLLIDEIDKVASRSNAGGADVSREGVQRDLLPLVEGSTVNTKHGPIKTDHILFIASGAFHLSKPSDLIPELQGRLPIRVELNALSVDDFKSILVEPDYSLTQQYTSLMKTEGVEVTFDQSAISRLSTIAWTVNEKTENIGARRLHTIMERLLENLSFDASDMKESKITIDEDYVNKYLNELTENEDLSRYIL